MNTIDMKTKDLPKEKIEILKSLFPSCIIDNKLDFELLKQELTDELLDERKEKYQLTWPGKKESITLGNQVTTKTLRPVKEKAINFDSTKNIYIEGDNLDVLKILQESYLGKIKCIYIDPPYNTGNDFIYQDNFSKSANDELISSGSIDEYCNKLVTNNSSSGRFHSDWLSMMYPRIKLARNLLNDEGILFISIDENEVHNLKKICDEIFGEACFISCLSWFKGFGKNESHFYSNNIEYILVYAKDLFKLNNNEENHFFIEKDGYKETKDLLEKLKRENKDISIAQDIIRKFYKENGYKGISAYNNLDNQYRLWRGVSMEKPKDPCYFYDIIHPITKKPCKKPKKGWRMPEKTMLEYIKQELIIFGNDENTIPNRKYFLDDMIFETPKNFIEDFSQGGNDILNIFDSNHVFDYPKSISFMNKLLKPALSDRNAIILDFFSGSATTAHAVMQLNAEDGGNRKYIMVQVPEKCSEKSEAFKCGYKTICEIGQERIRRAGQKIQKETNADIDYGFRVYKVDSSNMKDIYYKPSNLTQLNILDLASNIKEDRTSEDLLTQVILDLGLTLDLKIEEKNILNNKVYFVENNSLIACFDDNVNIDIIDEICKYNPLKVVFKDVSFKSDKDKINLEEKIKKLSPETEISIL